MTGSTDKPATQPTRDQTEAWLNTARVGGVLSLTMGSKMGAELAAPYRAGRIRILLGQRAITADEAARRRWVGVNLVRLS